MALLKSMARSRLTLLWLIGFVLFYAPFSRVRAQTPVSAEYQIKAAFLFNFAQFVEWPATAFRDTDDPLVIAVLGENPFGGYLDELVRGEKVGKRPLVVRHYRRNEDVKEAHILFISRSEAATMEKILSALKGRSILTVSDAEAFSRQGGMVRFVTQNGKIRLRINVEAAKACSLTISSKILRPASLVLAGEN